MTPQLGTPQLGVLGRRLLLAFTLVAALAVTLVTVAALVGSQRGLARQSQEEQRQRVTALAQLAGEAYERAGGWAGADLGEVRSAVMGTGASAVLLDASGTELIRFGGRGRMMGAERLPTTTVSAPVEVGGVRVGTLGATLPVAGTTGRDLAWSWVLGAAVVAVALAAAVGVAAARRLTRPLTSLITATRAYGAGERAARPAERGPGELGELADAFGEAADAVTSAELARRRMATDVAHELRTPLAALQAGLEELRDGLIEADPTSLGRLHDQSLRLGRVVEDLAEVAAAEAATHHLDLHLLDLGSAVRQAAGERAAQLRAAELTLTVEAPDGVWVRGDADRVHQVVGNLLANCAHHCRPGDAVHVAVGRAGGDAVLTVADTGPGIAAEDLPHVLTRFWRSDRARATTQGSGLGLAIAAELTRAHGGRLTVASPGGRGTTVTVHLPAAPAPPAEP